MIEKDIQKAKQYIHEADTIMIAAGAGMGVDSGLPDFRGNEGFWKAYPPIEKLGLGFQEMANPTWFDTNPALAWAFYGHRLNLYRDTTPHKGFSLLMALVKKKSDNYFIFTSNVDGQFQKAGFSHDKIAEVHGSIEHWQCSKNCKNSIWKADTDAVEIDMEHFKSLDIFMCCSCGEVARPNILMFGDWHWNDKRTNNQMSKFKKWLKSTRDKKLVIIEIGAGIEISTIRDECEMIAKKHPNAKLIRINPRDFSINPKFGVSIPFGGLHGLEIVLDDFDLEED